MYSRSLLFIFAVFCVEISITTQQLYQIGAGDCADVYAFSAAGTRPASGVQQLMVGYGRRNVTAYCDMVTDGGGWTVIQRRTGPALDFYRDWVDYERGFGNPAGDYWLGLTYIHSLTSSKKYVLRIELTDWTNKVYYAEYTNFVVGGAGCRYKLSSIGEYCGDIGDSMDYQLGMNFTTYDRDFDLSPDNCAQFFHGAWWYNSCHKSNLNGRYVVGGNTAVSGDGINWLTGKGYYYSYMKTEMKIRPDGF